MNAHNMQYGVYLNSKKCATMINFFLAMYFFLRHLRPFHARVSIGKKNIKISFFAG